MDAIESSWCSGLPTARVAGGSISPYITFSLPKQETKNACFRLTPPQLPVPAIGFIHKNNKTNNARKTIKKPILVPKVSFVPSVNELNGDAQHSKAEVLKALVMKAGNKVNRSKEIENASSNQHKHCVPEVVPRIRTSS